MLACSDRSERGLTACDIDASCTATGLKSGEVVSALPGGTQTPASATVAASTVQTDDTYKVCMNGLAFYVSGQVPIPQFCTTLHVPLALGATTS